MGSDNCFLKLILNPIMFRHAKYLLIMYHVSLVAFSDRLLSAELINICISPLLKNLFFEIVFLFCFGWVYNTLGTVQFQVGKLNKNTLGT